jgi:uncharacterized membrane protein
MNLAINNYSIIFVLWNVFLALVPCVIVYFFAKKVGRSSWSQIKWYRHKLFVIAFLVWLFFLPNTAYLFTMVRHIVDYCSDYDKYSVCVEEAWMPMFFFTYALIGVPNFYYALNKMSQVFKKLFGGLAFIALPIIVIPLTSIGVMFGLFERFNSWEVITKPMDIFKTGLNYFTDAAQLTNFLIFTIALYLIYYITDFLIWKIQE